MAPITRNSQATGGIGKKVHRKRPDQKPRSNSWALMHHQETHPDATDLPMEDPEEDIPPETNGSPDIAETIEPLREMADRVEDKVEKFAEELDKFITELPTVANRFDAVHDLVSTFKEIADGAVQNMKQKYQLELRDYMKREWSQQSRISTSSTAQRSFASGGASSVGSRRAEQIKELRQWQREADIWDLFRIMLELHPFESDAQALRAEREQDLRKLGPPHRYTSEHELWERFLLEDDLAREREKIKSWLERTAEHQQSDMQGVLEVLEAKAGKGKGLWSSGWMDTREKIKAQKLLRTWPSDAAARLPEIRRTDNRELVVTNLDPDAPTRQDRTLEKPDVYFERAMWIACWEMLRRGTDMAEVCKWCEDRKEGWRAVCLGQAMDFTDPTLSGAAWRRVCELASQAPNSNEYESAVFGLLGGNQKAVEKICRSVDDYLYAFYSANLLKQFDRYLAKACPNKAAPNGLRRIGGDEQNGSHQDAEQAEQAIQELIQRVRKGSATRDESAQPIKIVQSYLIADEVGSLIHTIGAAIGEASKFHGTENLLFLRGEGIAVDTLSLPELEVALNPQTLRIVTHMAILYGVLRPEQLEGDELHDDENVLVAYIQYLRTEGKRDNVPIYAARLQRERCISVLSQTLQDVSDPRDQREYLALLQEFDIDVVATMIQHLDCVLDNALKKKKTNEHALSILERTNETRIYPGQRIKLGFLPEDTDEEDDAIVHALSWFRLYQGGWKVSFDAFALAVRKCLVTGRFACARAIINKYPFDTISLSKSFDTIKKSIHVFDLDEESAPRDEQELLTLELLKRQSRTYFELEQLIRAIEALSLWRAEENEYVGKNPKPNSIPPSLKQLQHDVAATMEPIVQGILLEPMDEEEAKDLLYIRVNYIPEVIIAYITVLHTSGNVITRDCLLDAMDLANAIAKGKDANGEQVDYNGLEECFVQAGRMRELVECFALTSKLMLILKAAGRVWKPSKNDREGRDLGIFEIGGGRVAVAGEE